jgi:ribonuclease T1
MKIKLHLLLSGFLLSMLCIACKGQTVEDKRNTNTYIPTEKKEERSKKIENINSTRKKSKNSVEEVDRTEIPDYVLDVWIYVTKNNSPMRGYVGGRVFQNRERRLPQNENYQEWDVLPKIQGKNRGAERLVTDSKKTGYYTKDHYKTFKKFN